ncbi:hypothetical protein EVAR_29870_1 [Eumeta japonica]|uniref:Uncharacterized protein n=1 Tax=Eumeta variegata TaxID=151549 RepID=A0A4C1V9W3_EUMVA|nr:hypothetical protein EVAR_29870_1 [Eumeta japonica]
MPCLIPAERAASVARRNGRRKRRGRGRNRCFRISGVINQKAFEILSRGAKLGYAGRELGQGRSECLTRNLYKTNYKLRPETINLDAMGGIKYFTAKGNYCYSSGQSLVTNVSRIHVLLASPPAGPALTHALLTHMQHAARASPAASCMTSERRSDVTPPPRQPGGSTGEAHSCLLSRVPTQRAGPRNTADDGTPS